jgi:alkylated DNA repair dioxygenase AlkB
VTLIEDLLPPDEQAVLLAHLIAELPWAYHQIRIMGRPGSEHRRTAWLAERGLTYVYSGLLLEPSPWTEATVALRGRLEELLAAEFRGVLCNL